MSSIPGGGSAARVPASRLDALLRRFGVASALDFRLTLRQEEDTRVLHDGLAGDPRSPGQSLERPLAGGGRLELEYRGRAGGDPGQADEMATFLLDWAARFLRYDRELTLFSREMAERYEELTLLTSISETLGSHIQVHRAAEVILEELASVLDVERAALWLADEADGELRPFAARTAPAEGATPADAPEEGATQEGGAEEEPELTRGVFSRQEPVLANGERPLLSVPVAYTPPEGAARRLGVLNLVRRRGDAPFRAGDLRLMTTVASQIGVAIQNGRLVEESLRRERVLAELEIAHDLQLKILPHPDSFSDLAEVAARFDPAESIGGDFYSLFRLTERRLGVMLGDVSSHGISAALIMALTMSAASIYARERDGPGEVLLRIHRQLLRELESADMYLTLFYGVLDPAGSLRYANAGHPFAYRLGSQGAERLEALDPPLGTVRREHYAERRMEWRCPSDRLLLFTDGLVEGDGAPTEAELLEEAVRGTGKGAADLVEMLFARGAAGGRDDRTALAVRL